MLIYIFISVVYFSASFVPFSFIAQCVTTAWRQEKTFTAAFLNILEIH